MGSLIFIVWKEQHEHPAKHSLLCSTEDRKLHEFRMTWGWINDDRFSFWGELSLKKVRSSQRNVLRRSTSTTASWICYSLTFTSFDVVCHSLLSPYLSSPRLLQEHIYQFQNRLCSQITNNKISPAAWKHCLLKCLRIDLEPRCWIIGFKSDLSPQTLKFHHKPIYLQSKVIWLAAMEIADICPPSGTDTPKLIHIKTPYLSLGERCYPPLTAVMSCSKSNAPNTKNSRIPRDLRR